MEKKKVLVINAGTCDTRKVQEATLSAYEKVVINSGTVIVNQSSKVLLDQYLVELNAGDVLEAEEGVQFSSVNGRAEIKPGAAADDRKIVLEVNGTLDVAPGSEEVLKHYVSIQVNGTVNCPESIAGLLGMVQLNGSMETYPDDAICLKRTAMLERTFLLRAKENAHYFASRRIVAVDAGVNFGALAEKGVHFTTKELLVAESLAEAAVPLFDEKAEITILPDGCAFINDDALLDDDLVSRYGKKLYINGDLTVNGESTAALGQVEYLRVNGEVRAVKSLAEALKQVPHLEYQELKLLAGVVLSDRVSVTVDRAMLERAEEGVSIMDCAKVKFAPDVSPDLIRERVLEISDCAKVHCTDEQRSAVEVVARDVAHIGGSDEEQDDVSGVLDRFLSLVAEDGVDVESLGAAEKAKLLLRCKVVKAGDYVL